MKNVIIALVLSLLSTAALAVNLTTATEQEIAAALKGVGPVKAKRIKEAKPKNFDELLKVKGIGPKTIEKNKADIEF